MSKHSYSQKLLDPRWQKKRLEIFTRDGWKCLYCGDDKTTLNVHHIRYESKEPWECSNDNLITLCSICHEEESVLRKTCEHGLLDALLENRFSIYDIEFLESSIRDGKLTKEAIFNMATTDGKPNE